MCFFNSGCKWLCFPGVCCPTHIILNNYHRSWEYLVIEFLFSARLRNAGGRRRSNFRSDSSLTPTSAPRGQRVKLTQNDALFKFICSWFTHPVSLLTDLIYFSTHLNIKYIFLFKTFSIKTKTSLVKFLAVDWKEVPYLGRDRIRKCRWRFHWSRLVMSTCRLGLGFENWAADNLIWNRCCITCYMGYLIPR